MFYNSVSRICVKSFLCNGPRSQQHAINFFVCRRRFPGSHLDQEISYILILFLRKIFQQRSWSRCSSLYPKTNQHRFASCSTSKLNSHWWPAGCRGRKFLSLKTNCIFHRLLWGVLKQSERHKADYPIDFFYPIDLCQCICLDTINNIEKTTSIFGLFHTFPDETVAIFSIRDFLFINWLHKLVANSVAAHFKDYKVNCSWAPVLLNKSFLI